MTVEMTKAVQGALRIDKKFDIIANHLANAGTTGYKAETLSFDEMLRAQMRVDMRQGMLQNTGNPLDLALSGDGLFKVETSQGIRYTRNGTFLIDDNNYLVTQEGYRVLGDDGPLTIDGTEVTISEAGDVDVDGEQVGKLAVVTFGAKERLVKEAAGLFAYDGPAMDEKRPERIQVNQGALEQSNVSAVVEMTKLIQTTRQFESFQKLIHTCDEMDAKAISEVGQVR